MIEISRQSEIIRNYILAIQDHLFHLLKGEAEDMFEIEDFAAQLFIHATHLSNTAQEYSNLSPCAIYQINILRTSFKLLTDYSVPVNEIALSLAFSPSQFSKWFKRYTGITPRQYRSAVISNAAPGIKSEMMNIFLKYDQLLLKLQIKEQSDEYFKQLRADHRW